MYHTLCMPLIGLGVPCVADDVSSLLLFGIVTSIRCVQLANTHQGKGCVSRCNSNLVVSGISTLPADKYRA